MAPGRPSRGRGTRRSALCHLRHAAVAGSQQYELRWPGSAIEARCTTTDALASELHARAVPPLDALVELPAGSYVVGEPEEERIVALGRVLVGRWPVVNAHMRAFAAATARPLTDKLAAPQLADHPVTDVTRSDALAFCAWASAELGRRARLPT